MDELPTQPDALSLAQVSPEAMDHDALVVEVRRLRLRLDALREQRDERITQIQALEQELGGLDETLRAMLRGEDVSWKGDSPPPANRWRERALAAEAEYHALLQTRSMRLLRVPRSIYAKVRAARAG